MIKASDKDMEALRAGLRQELESEFHQEEVRRIWKRISARVSVPAQRVRLLPAANVGPGAVLVATDDGQCFYEYAEVLSADSATRPGRRCLNYNLRAAGTGGHSYDLDDLVLVAVPE